MDNKEQFYLRAAADYLAPAVGVDGEWGSVGGIAVRESLSLGSVSGAIDLLGAMDAKVAAGVLSEAGFAVSAGVVDLGREAVLGSVRGDLEAAARMRVDGFGLASSRAGVQHSFVAKDFGGLAFSVAGYGGDREAAAVIQGVMRASKVSVDLMGDALPGERGVLALVAGQALRDGVQGFGFDGIAGKYEVPLSMAEVLDLHRDAAAAVAEQSARSGLGAWVAGAGVKDVSEWVPDSIQRLLHGSVSLAAASLVVQAVEGGAIGRHASDIGAHKFTKLLADLGFDINAKTVDEQAADLGLAVDEVNTDRGLYVGTVVGLDHRAGLVKFNRSAAVVLPFAGLADGQERPVLGDMVRMKFAKGELAVSVSERVGREGVGR